MSVDLLYTFDILNVGDCSMDILILFGTNVRKYRLALNMSQEDLAEKSGLHRTYISAIECFRRSISLENIQRIANALEIQPYQLFLDNDHT